MKKNLEKSSRAKADLFELLITQGLINYFKIKRDYTKQLIDLRQQLKQFPAGRQRITDQEKKYKKLLPQIIHQLKQNKEPIKDITWIGRNFVQTKSLADVLIDYGKAQSLGISLKSVGQGTGTQKNVGYKTLKQYLDLNIDRDLKTMWQRIKSHLSKRGGPYARISKLKNSQIKRSKYRYKEIQKVAKIYGLPVQKKATDESVKNFNRLSFERKLEFLKYLLGYDPKAKLLTIIATRNNTITYSNEKYKPLVSGKIKISAKKVKDKSYCILINQVSSLRIQSSFTNGVGLSAFCQRAFLTNI